MIVMAAELLNLDGGGQGRGSADSVQIAVLLTDLLSFPQIIHLLKFWLMAIPSSSSLCHRAVSPFVHSLAFATNVEPDALG